PPKLKNRTTKKIKYFDNDELKKFLSYLDSLDDTIDNQLHVTMYRFLLATGLRVGECLALSWSDIDFNNETVSVYKTILQNGTLQNSTKTKESTRVVAFDKEISHSLKMWQSSQSTQRKVVSLSNQYVFSLNNSNLIYAYESLKLQNHFKNAKVSNIGFHGFRHTHASLLMNADVNPKEIQLRLGHADYSITMNTYSHLSKDKKKDTAEKFGNILKAL
ncbi:MAG: site-specific integrase, partial [Pseudolactococcus laudensis]|uniref:site-specific integrase n=1 Tax=Pseudolactococcus laudensis TaxID=1494461 RepID=UPI003F95C8F0